MITKEVVGDMVDEMWDFHTRTTEKFDMDLSTIEGKDTFAFGAMHICCFLRESAMKGHEIDFKALNSACDSFESYLVEKGVTK